MFNFMTCAHPGCRTYICEDGPFCFRHAPDKQVLQKRCIETFLNEEPMVDFSLTGSEFEDLVLPKKEITASNLAWCTFRNIDFSHSTLINTFFDYCLFERCKFNSILSRYSVFSGSKMIDCDFSGSIIIHTNFCGVDTYRCNFNDSDLYFSTFNSSYLRDTTFEDCNLKKADFVHTDQRRVSFRYSNYEEARH
ncbi:pentapeptide repeat-containing protein [Sphaerochaeta globosa]|uniref:Pentapeptide repeat protein n=1 Tax=Sphaerochaeta globosa (strain ATCC BAA-1886 / DSM 22777 / Buddy) TaxID=158189 RepID=F0RVZ9_SPHGB|nr:pentapeptide repeat-containing protein [Sphaerochaeta globosa]ADY13285.1 pentapeptide repeat protein [Sphaerochaeta globosa str. Buddy]